MEEKQQSKEQYNGVLEEYKTSRTELMKRQDARLYIIGFTMAAIGTILGLILRDYASIAHELNYYVTTLVCFALIMLIVALILTTQHTQHIIFISKYIRKFIEPEIHGIRWETRWNEYRELKREDDAEQGWKTGEKKCWKSAAAGVIRTRDLAERRRHFPFQ